MLDERCRQVLPWSESARAGLLKVAPAVAAKTTTLLPAIRPVAERPKTRGGGPLKVLFVGTAFYEKGAIEAVRAVARTPDAELDLVSYVPPDFKPPSNVTVHVPARRDLVERLYARCHVLLFPSHMDTFGYVVLEAMAHGLPVVAPGHLALNELIEDGESGIHFAPENPLYGADGLSRFPHLLPPPHDYVEALKAPSEPYVAGIADALERVNELYDRLAAGALERVRSGPLSMERRRAALARIYGDATS
jgi:glycosyltransferase involved in cell wall biosynthesis